MQASNRQSSIVNRKLLFVVFSLFAAPALLAQNPYTVYGNVKQPDGSPASRATVSISSSAGLSRQAFADDMGRYEIPNLPRGRYRLTAINPAEPDQFMDPAEVDLSQTTGTRVSVHLYLRYKTKVVTPKEKQSGVISLEEESQRVPKTAQRAFDQAMEFRSRQKFDQSIKSFDKAIQAFPDYFQALTERGHLRIAINQPAEAAADFAGALAINPRYGPALRGAGICEFQQGKYAEAIRDLAHAVDAEPGNATNYLFIGVANVALDHREQAHAALQKALSIDPVGSNRAHVHLASLYIRDNRPQEAIREIEAYLDAVPDAPDAEKLRALLSQLRAQSSKN